MGCPSLPWGRLDKEQSGGRGGGVRRGLGWSGSWSVLRGGSRRGPPSAPRAS